MDEKWSKLFGDKKPPKGYDIELIRAYTDMGTYGVLLIGNDFRCYTVERPWKGNIRRESCIPEGCYLLKKRLSPIVERTSRGRYREGWELTGVDGRTFIMIHPANVPDELEGCIGVGDGYGYYKNQWSVSNSVNTFYKLMERLEARDEWIIRIRTRTQED